MTAPSMWCVACRRWHRRKPCTQARPPRRGSVVKPVYAPHRAGSDGSAGRTVAARLLPEPVFFGWGRSLAKDAIGRLDEALDAAPTLNASLDSAAELLGAIDQARASLDVGAAMIVLLLGDWSRILVELDAMGASGYESPPPTRRDIAWDGERARYRGDPVVVDYSTAERRLYVVEPGPWGVFERAQAGDDQDLLVEIDPIPAERAREMLADDPELFPDLPDAESRLLRIQTFVRVGVGERSGFRVSDPTRARRVLPRPSAA